jgi:KTSC domain
LDFRGDELGHLQWLGGLAWHFPFGVADLIPTKLWFAAGNTLVSKIGKFKVAHYQARNRGLLTVVFVLECGASHDHRAAIQTVGGGDPAGAVSSDRFAKERGLYTMKRIPCSSPGIPEVGYHQDSDDLGTLELMFSNGSVYQFFNVPTNIYDEFMHSPSKEDYYVAKIGKRFPHAHV